MSIDEMLSRNRDFMVCSDFRRNRDTVNSHSIGDFMLINFVKSLFMHTPAAIYKNVIIMFTHQGDVRNYFRYHENVLMPTSGVHKCRIYSQIQNMFRCSQLQNNIMYITKPL